MKVYIDYIFLINLVFDFIILVGINLVLKRNAKIYRIIFGSIIGAFSIFILFFSMPNIIFTSLKIIFGLIMVIITFSYKNIKYTLNNFLYLMIISFVLGGFLYMLNIEVGYEHVGMVFIKNNDGLNMLILILFAILIMIVYTKSNKKLKRHLSSNYKVVIYIKDKTYELNGFLDSGNNLCDPYLNRPISIINSSINIDFSSCKFIYVPYKALNKTGMLKCYIVDKIFIENIGYKYNYLIGVSNDKISLSGVDIILNGKIMEEIWKNY